MSESIQQRLIEWSVDKEWHNFHSPFQQNPYYIPYPHMIRKCYGLNMNERGVLLDILCHLGKNEEAFPSQETIACNLGISESTVKSAITSLEKKGFIKTVRRRGRVNRYRIDQLESNPYVGLSETVHYFLQCYQPRYIKKSLIQSVISDVVHSDSYASYARRIREAYLSPDPSDVSYPDLMLDTILELLGDIRMRLWEKKGMQYRCRFIRTTNTTSNYT